MRVCGEFASRMTARVCQAQAASRGGDQAAANANDAAAQFDEYLRGEREAFDFELDWDGRRAGPPARPRDALRDRAVTGRRSRTASWGSGRASTIHATSG